MARIIFALREILAAAVFLIPIFIGLNRYLFQDLRKTSLYFVFSCYLAAVYVLVGMPNIAYVRFELNLNLVPMIGILQDAKNSLLNVFLFVPLGFFLPLLWNGYRMPGKTILFGFAMSAAIELLQIFTLRATDVNDVITNTFGTCLGFALAEVLRRCIPAVRNIHSGEKAGELHCIMAVVLAVMFFAQPFSSAVLWNWIY